MDIFVIIACLVIISAAYSYINARYIKLPGTIGIISLAVAVSVLVLIVKKLSPASAKYVTTLVGSIDFSTAMLNIMLGFLLFAGSFNVDVKRLRKEFRPVMVLSTLSVMLSTVAFGTIFYYVAPLFHIFVPFIYCLLFGALVSPTDPVAVLAIVKGSKLPNHLETIIGGESLFNDGVGLVLFITILDITQTGVENVSIGSAALLFVKEVFGGLVLGVLFGFIAFRLMRSITHFETIVLVSLSLVMGISVVGTYLHLSVPLAVVMAGLFTGNRSINNEEGERSHQALERFWHLIDELLNTVLFVMIGLQVVNFPFLNNYWITGGLSIVLILVSRWISIALPLTFLRKSLNVKYKNVTILTWAGVRGGISIALALSLPHNKYRELILAGSYFIVIFSIIVQGLTLNRLIEKAYPNHAAD
jgi:monovalent cation:H+ antiporter, CPA1 family